MKPIRSAKSSKFELPCPGTPRRGLAPLELVLVLPLLLFVMALFINAGTSAAWKVRAEGVARDAVWRERWPAVAPKPIPAPWPENDAPMSRGDQGQMALLNHPNIDQPVVRGPRMGPADVNRELFDPTVGTWRGFASIERQRPLLPVLGNMKYDVDHPFFDLTWTYDQTNLSNTYEEDRGQYYCRLNLVLSGNRLRRLWILYDFHETEVDGAQDYDQAASQLQTTVDQTNVLPLTFVMDAWCYQTEHEDPDFRRLGYPQDPKGFIDYGTGGRLRFFPRSPDFHPRIPDFCSLDVEEVRRYVENLIIQIKGNENKTNNYVARHMARTYISLYRGAISIVEQHLASLKAAEASPDAIAPVQAELDRRKAELEPKIKELEDFLASL